MELQQTTAGTLAPPRTSGTEGLWSVLGRLIFLRRRSLTNTIEKPDCDTSAENFFHFPFLSPRRVSHFPLILNALQPFAETFSTNVKTQRIACHILRARVSSAKTMLHSTPCSQESAQNTSPLSGKNALLFPLRPPLSDPRRAQRCGERTSRVCAHPRASVGFRFLPSPFTLGPQQPDCSGVGGEDAAHFSSFTAAPDVCSPGEDRSAKAFTPYALKVNALTKVGEEVKAKNEKRLTRARVGA